MSLGPKITGLWAGLNKFLRGLVQSPTQIPYIELILNKHFPGQGRKDFLEGEVWEIDCLDPRYEGRQPIVITHASEDRLTARLLLPNRTLGNAPMIANQDFVNGAYLGRIFILHEPQYSDPWEAECRPGPI